MCIYIYTWYTHWLCFNFCWLLRFNFHQDKTSGSGVLQVAHHIGMMLEGPDAGLRRVPRLPPIFPIFFSRFFPDFFHFFPAKRQRQWLNKGNWWISDWFPDDFPKFESCWKIFHEMLEPWSHFHEHFMADGWIAGSLLDQVLALTRHKMQSKAAMQARSPRSFASSLSPCFIKVDLFIRGYSIYLLIHLST